MLNRPPLNREASPDRGLAGQAPTFSIITANFNSGRKLAASAASVLDGNGVDLEYLIMDGASNDESIDHAKQLARDQPHRVKLFSEADRGIYGAMNHGIRLATGRYLYFIGAGDKLLPGALEKIVPSLPLDGRAFVYGQAQMDIGLYAGRFNRLKLCKKNICHQAIFYGREALQLCGQYDLRYRISADWDLNIRCFGHKNIKKVYVPLVIAEYEGGGVSVAGDPLFKQDKIAIVRRHLGLIPCGGLIMWRYICEIGKKR